MKIFTPRVTVVTFCVWTWVAWVSNLFHWSLKILNWIRKLNGRNLLNEWYYLFAAYSISQFVTLFFTVKKKGWKIISNNVPHVFGLLKETKNIFVSYHEGNEKKIYHRSRIFPFQLWSKMCTLQYYKYYCDCCFILSFLLYYLWLNPWKINSVVQLQTENGDDETYWSSFAILCLY